MAPGTFLPENNSLLMSDSTLGSYFVTVDKFQNVLPYTSDDTCIMATWTVEPDNLAHEWSDYDQEICDGSLKGRKNMNRSNTVNQGCGHISDDFREFGPQQTLEQDKECRHNSSRSVHDSFCADEENSEVGCSFSCGQCPASEWRSSMDTTELRKNTPLSWQTHEQQTVLIPTRKNIRVRNVSPAQGNVMKSNYGQYLVHLKTGHVYKEHGNPRVTHDSQSYESAARENQHSRTISGHKNDIDAPEYYGRGRSPEHVHGSESRNNYQECSAEKEYPKHILDDPLEGILECKKNRDKSGGEYVHRCPFHHCSHAHMHATRQKNAQNFKLQQKLTTKQHESSIKAPAKGKLHAPLSKSIDCTLPVAISETHSWSLKLSLEPTSNSTPPKERVSPEVLQSSSPVQFLHSSPPTPRSLRGNDPDAALPARSVIPDLPLKHLVRSPTVLVPILPSPNYHSATPPHFPPSSSSSSRYSPASNFATTDTKQTESKDIFNSKICDPCLRIQQKNNTCRSPSNRSNEELHKNKIISHELEMCTGSQNRVGEQRRGCLPSTTKRNGDHEHEAHFFLESRTAEIPIGIGDFKRTEMHADAEKKPADCDQPYLANDSPSTTMGGDAYYSSDYPKKKRKNKPTEFVPRSLTNVSATTSTGGARSAQEDFHSSGPFQEPIRVVEETNLSHLSPTCISLESLDSTLQCLPCDPDKTDTTEGRDSQRTKIPAIPATVAIGTPQPNQEITNSLRKKVIEYIVQQLSCSNITTSGSNVTTSGSNDNHNAFDSSNKNNCSSTTISNNSGSSCKTSNITSSREAQLDRLSNTTHRASPHSPAADPNQRLTAAGTFTSATNTSQENLMLTQASNVHAASATTPDASNVHAASATTPDASNAPAKDVTRGNLSRRDKTSGDTAWNSGTAVHTWNSGTVTDTTQNKRAASSGGIRATTETEAITDKALLGAYASHARESSITMEKHKREPLSGWPPTSPVDSSMLETSLTSKTRTSDASDTSPTSASITEIANTSMMLSSAAASSLAAAAPPPVEIDIPSITATSLITITSSITTAAIPTSASTATLASTSPSVLRTATSLESLEASIMASNSSPVSAVSNSSQVVPVSNSSPTVDASHSSPTVEASHSSPTVEASHSSPTVEASHSSPTVEASHSPPTARSTTNLSALSSLQRLYKTVSRLEQTVYQAAKGDKESYLRQLAAKLATVYCQLQHSRQVSWQRT